MLWRRCFIDSLIPWFAGLLIQRFIVSLVHSIVVHGLAHVISLAFKPAFSHSLMHLISSTFQRFSSHPFYSQFYVFRNFRHITAEHYLVLYISVFKHHANHMYRPCVSRMSFENALGPKTTFIHSFVHSFAHSCNHSLMTFICSFVPFIVLISFMFFFHVFHSCHSFN